MATKRTKKVWYSGGLRFECTGCGRCCTEPEDGYVEVKARDARRLAAHLGMEVGRFREAFCERAGRGWRLRMPKGVCPFLAGDGKLCTVHDAKPDQCASFPWWPEVLASRRAWEAEAPRCEGVGRGDLIPAAEITARLRSARGEPRAQKGGAGG